MKRLHTTTAALELAAGLALLGCPAASAALLLGEPLVALAALTLARVCGAALLSLGAACWFARSDAQGRAARGLVAALLLYNLGVAGELTYARLGSGLQGPLLWPGVAVHTGMAGWCVACLTNRTTMAKRPTA